MRTHKYKGIMSTIKDNICGDGYDAEIRAENIFNKVKNKIDKAYKQGRADAIKEFLKAYREMPLTLSINECDKYMQRVADQLKEEK